MNIVIIDDEVVICNGIENIINKTDNDWIAYEVYTDAEEALEFCDWDKVDLLLSDINMPNIDGLLLVDILKDRGHDIQVIFISGYTEFEYAQKALQQKAIDYIIKPVSVKNLIEAICKTEKIIEDKKKTQSDERFIRNNIISITKNFIFDMMFETRCLSEQEIEEGLKYCELINKRFSLISFMLDDTDEISRIVEKLNKEDYRIFLYTSKSNYNVMVVCEDQKENPKVDILIKKVNVSCPKFVVGQVKYSDSILELSDMNYDMMSQLKEDLYSKTKNIDSYYSNIESIDRKVSSPHVVSAIQYIKEHYSKKISLATLAEELYVHPTYLSNSFKKQMGINIVDFINNYRIEVAKDLLKDSRNKIYWVAERVGFANQRYFSQKFKMITGYTPVEYKQKIYFNSN